MAKIVIGAVAEVAVFLLIAIRCFSSCIGLEVALISEGAQIVFLCALCDGVLTLIVVNSMQTMK